MGAASDGVRRTAMNRCQLRRASVRRGRRFSRIPPGRRTSSKVERWPMEGECMAVAYATMGTVEEASLSGSGAVRVVSGRRSSMLSACEARTRSSAAMLSLRFRRMKLDRWEERSPVCRARSVPVSCPRSMRRAISMRSLSWS